MSEFPTTPPSPTVPPSEPEREKQFVKNTIKKAAEERLQVIELSAAAEYLYKYNLHLDEDGFLRNSENEYAVPYIFQEKLLDETDSPADDVFNDYFKPLTDCPEYTDPTYSEKIHLTDLVTIFVDEEETPHPVKDDVFAAEKLFKRTGLLYTTVTSWSSVYNRFGFGEGLQDLKTLQVRTYGLEKAPKLKLNCMNTDCGYRSEYSDWDGEDNDPVCPDCGGEWLETINECTNCGEWHWGVNMDGDGIYAEPVCPHCSAGMEALTRITRY